MSYIVDGAFDIPDDLITVKDLLEKFNVDLLLPKRILELEIPNDFTSYKYYQNFNDLPKDEQEEFYYGYESDIEEGIIESVEEYFESFHRFTGEFHVIEIQEFPIEGFTVEDIPNGEDVGEFLINKENLDFAMSTCLMYYQYHSPNLTGFPLIIEYEWSGYQSSTMHN